MTGLPGKFASEINPKIAAQPVPLALHHLTPAEADLTKLLNVLAVRRISTSLSFGFSRFN